MKYLAIMNNKDENLYSTFGGIILPLKDYSIGFDVSFDVNEINEISKNYKTFIIVNRFMHKNDLENIKNVIKELKLDNIEKIFIEDFGLTNIFGYDKVILYPNHVINNFESINYYKEIGIDNIVVSNELTYKELMDIRKNTTSKLYYFYINRNTIMNSKRSLITNYKKYYGYNDNEKTLLLSENISKNKYIMKEYGKQTILLCEKVFVGSKYKSIIGTFDYLIINLNNLSEEERNIILENYDKEDLHNKISCDYYFLENEISYKVGDVK